jgi:cytochrome c oxidase subunit II
MRLGLLPVFFVAAVGATTSTLAQDRTPVVPGAHDALAGAGVQAAHIGHLWNVVLAVCTIVFCAVLIGFVVALWRAGRATPQTAADLSSLGRHERGPYLSVVWSVAVAIVLLLALLVASVVTDRAIARMPLENAVSIEVTGHQWWWELTYQGATVADNFTTANELHVPVGRPVVLTLRGADVIHSFWVPSLAGKKDLIPGRTTTLSFRADQPGTYRGQCAEFCGFQHAFMAFEVVADPPDRFEAWQNAQRRPAADPVDATARHGQDVFLRSACVMCHAVEGTIAGARNAPDLTHVGSRSTLAAGTLPNRPAQMAQWIADPQHFKPGANMPATRLSGSDMGALVAYLEGLK